MVKIEVIELKKIQSIEKKIVVFLVKKVEMDASYWARNMSSKMSEKNTLCNGSKSERKVVA